MAGSRGEAASADGHRDSRGDRGGGRRIPGGWWHAASAAAGRVSRTRCFAARRPNARGARRVRTCGMGWGPGKGEMKQRVVVWGERVDVEVYRRSKTVWIARGEYNGKSYEGKASTRGSAAK